MNDSASPAQDRRAARPLRLAGDIHVEQAPVESPASAEAPGSLHLRVAGSVKVEEMGDDAAAPGQTRPDPPPVKKPIRGRFFRLKAAEERFFRLKGEINLVHLIVALLALWVAYRNLNNSLERNQREVNERIQSAQQQVSGQVQKVQNEVMAQKFVITFPAEGSTVRVNDLVRGKTPFLDKNTYVVITPVETGDNFVQEGPVRVGVAGTWTSQARFGSGEVGVGQKFVIRALSTQSVLHAGELTAAQVPQDAVFSESVTVVRR
jgi:hypothetical protein